MEEASYNNITCHNWVVYNDSFNSTFNLSHNWDNQTLKQSVSIADIIPTGILILEALAGFTLNLAAILLYSKNQTLLKNAGNMFTISLMWADIIFSGIGLPVTIILQIKSFTTIPSITTYNTSPISRGILMLGAVASATGTALLGLQRGDVSLRPSRRFFVQKRPISAIVIVWFLSFISFFLPILSQLIFKENQRDGNYSSSSLPSLKQILYNENYQNQTLNQSLPRENIVCNISCGTVCKDHLYNLSRLQLAFQTGYQTTLFVAAATIILTVYLKILRSVHKRNVKQAKKTVEGVQSLNTAIAPGKTKRIIQTVLCCRKTKQENVVFALTPSQDAQQPLQMSQKKVALPEKQDTNQKLPFIRQIEHKEKMENKKLVSNQTNSTVIIETMNECDNKSKQTKFSSSNTTKELLSVESQVPTHDVNTKLDRDISGGKRDFASVALSITVVLTLRRMMAAKMKQKQKKIRHLKRMTSIIIFQFLVCWIPFYTFPIIKLLTENRENAEIICEILFCTQTSVNKNTTMDSTFSMNKGSDAIWNSVFLWTLVIASASSVTNPILYSFCRETVRKEFHKLCCSNHLSSGDGGTHSHKKQTRYSAIWSTQWKKKRVVNISSLTNTPTRTKRNGTENNSCDRPLQRCSTPTQ